MPDADTSATNASPETSTATESQTSEVSHETEERAPSLLDRMSERLFGHREQERDASDTSGVESKTAAQQYAKREYTDDEFQRAVQSETDRRESKRAAEQRLADKQRLREEDPYAYVDQEKAEEAQREAEQQFSSFLGNVAHQFDVALLDPIMERLPETERAKLINDDKLNVETLDGRRALQSAAVEALVRQARSQGKAEAEESLRKNSAFRKQVLSEFRRSDEHQEPELVPAAGAAANGHDMTAWMRSSLGRYRPPRS